MKGFSPRCTVYEIRQRKFQNFGTGWAKKQAGSSRIMERAFLKGFEIMSKSQGFVHINGTSTTVSGLNSAEPDSLSGSSHVICERHLGTIMDIVSKVLSEMGGYGFS